MDVTQVNMYDVGGAFQAAYRLQNSLRDEQINSNFLVLYQHNKHLNNLYPFLDNPNFFKRIKQSVIFRDTQKKINKLIGNKPKIEFRFSFSPFKIHEHPLIQQADIVHLHWMAKFLDYPSFFINIKKVIIERLQ